MAELIYKDESYAIMGSCFEVYKEKGHGFVEPVYQECLELELSAQNIAFEAQKALGIRKMLKYQNTVVVRTENVYPTLHSKQRRIDDECFGNISQRAG